MCYLDSQAYLIKWAPLKITYHACTYLLVFNHIPHGDLTGMDNKDPLF